MAFNLPGTGLDPRTGSNVLFKQNNTLETTCEKLQPRSLNNIAWEILMLFVWLGAFKYLNKV